MATTPRPRVAVLIPFKTLNDDVRKCLDWILRMDYQDFEILLLPDEPLEAAFPKTRVIPAGPVVPAIKRNIAIFAEDYEFFASIDSDAYPERSWLSKALPIFDDDPLVCAVGGPNLARLEAGPLEVGAHDVMYARLGLSTAYYYKKYKGDLVEAKELASSNLILRRSDFLKTRGYDTVRPTGEDTILCFALRQLDRKKIIYSPEVRVHHRRRPLFRPHLSRAYAQAKDKVAVLLGSFKPGNFIYFVPSLFVLFLLFGTILSAFSGLAARVFLGLLGFYLLCVLLDGLRLRNPLRIAVFMAGLPLTHIVYGLGYITGTLFPSRARDTAPAADKLSD
jgi:hypothetical protein